MDSSYSKQPFSFSKTSSSSSSVKPLSLFNTPIAGTVMDPPYLRKSHETKSLQTPQTSITPLAGEAGALQRAAIQKLNYGIHAVSSQASIYHPSNILVNNPQDQSSRWSSVSNNQNQFITLKLEKLSVIDTITFGKYHKVHVCNLKEFKVYGGMTPDSMKELLHAGLRNDSEPETFALKHRASGVTFPCLYLKIVPLVAWGANFNFSIWYVELRGICQPDVVQSVYWEYIQYREKEALRLCLKHFRQRNYMDCFDALQSRVHLDLEDSLLTKLHEVLVIQGDFDTAEALLEEAHSRSLFEEYISTCTYKPQWKRILPLPSSSAQETPCMRGGHQMCIDTESGRIYLFGGWDGTKDLADFWVFDQNTSRWECISPDTRRQNGPGPRSCHKICFDPSTKQLYTLGRYVDQESRPNVPLDNDFWRYDVSLNKWFRISGSTQAEGGPELLYDHQMVVDSEHQVLYVFGGRTVAPDVTQTTYSGLYSYSIQTNQWKLLRSDTNQPDNEIQLKSRLGHSMLFNPHTRELYIFAGQRNKDFLSDFYIYEIDSDTVYEISRDYSKQGGPDAGFTQRAALDEHLGEIYIFSGLMREKNASQETVRNTFWVYSMHEHRWTKVYQNENASPEYWAKMGHVEPRPRYAHQLVYDPIRRKQFLFGGNPGESGNAAVRLDDFWELELKRPNSEQILRRAKFLIRRQRFWELCRGGPSSNANGTLNALSYLQTQVSQVVDHKDDLESKAFRELSGYLFLWNGGASASPKATPMTADGPEAFAKMFGSGPTRPTSDVSSARIDSYPYRTTMYESLLEFFPSSMKQPQSDLIDLVQMQ